MEYGVIIWDPYTETNINRLERIQRQVTHNIIVEISKGEEVKLFVFTIKLIYSLIPQLS